MPKAHSIPLLLQGKGKISCHNLQSSKLNRNVKESLKSYEQKLLSSEKGSQASKLPFIEQACKSQGCNS